MSSYAIPHLLFVAALFIPAAARAECAIPSVERDFTKGDVVFIGRAVNQEVAGSPRHPPPRNRSTETTFEIEQIWKGKPDAPIRVQTCGWNEGGRILNCSDPGFRFVVGERYLVFAFGNPSNTWETDGCTATSRVDRAEDFLKWLADKPSTKLR